MSTEERKEWKPREETHVKTAIRMSSDSTAHKGFLCNTVPHLSLPNPLSSVYHFLISLELSCAFLYQKCPLPDCLSCELQHTAQSVLILGEDITDPQSLELFLSLLFSLKKNFFNWSTISYNVPVSGVQPYVPVMHI